MNEKWWLKILLLGELDNGASLREMILNQEEFFGPDMPSALLVLGGTAMSFHYQSLQNVMKGVPVTMALGDPVSGKSSAVEASMSLFNVREAIGGKHAIFEKCKTIN